MFNEFPTDWPGAGSIDLAIHDLPHNSATTEWWYVNSHITTLDDRQFSLFASFFRRVIGYDEQKPRLAYSLTWAISDPENEQYYADSLIDKCAPQVGLEILDSNPGKTDPMIERALREMLEKGSIPYPDRLFKKDGFVSSDKLELDFEGNRLVKLTDGSYELTLYNEEIQAGCSLVFTPEKPMIRHGDNGVVRGVSGEKMFYYFTPRCRVEGSLTLNDQILTVKEASGWYDHEFGSMGEEKAEADSPQDVAWNWISAQLENGYEVTAYDLFDVNQKGKSCGRWVIIIDPEGNWQEYQEFSFEPQEGWWTSTRTFIDYPTKWKLEVPAANLSLAVEAAFPTQEFVSVISKPAFWEGRVNVEGEMNGLVVKGPGFIERSGFCPIHRLDQFLAAVSRETRKSIRAILPIEPTYEQMRQLVAGKGREHYLQGIDPDQYSRALIQPLREIIDRGGKSWRSYAPLACFDAVGGDSRRELGYWLAVTELLHVGSLIVDDVEDKSSIRRGGPACHKIYGEALAINCGTASYFLFQILLIDSRFSVTDKLRIYELYFETLRAAHAGQALDIDGLSYIMPEVVESGDGEFLEKRVLATHRLKSAVPARTSAEIGAILAQGTPEQIEGMGNFFEMLGLAYQIIDDVLNLRGFKNNLKSRGEDISHGKVTMPIAKAMSQLPLLERRWLWDIISSKPTDLAVISAVIELLEKCNALDACEQQARDLVDSAWQKLDPLIRDSDVKIRLRAFGWYVFERHY